MANKSADKPMVDIAKPGSSAPDPSSRPVIVGHKTLAQDPMLNAEEEAMKSKSKTRKVIQPSGKANDEGNEEETTSNLDEDKTKDSNEAVVDAVVDQIGDKRKQELENEEAEKKRQEIEALIEEKKYFVHIKPTRNKRRIRAFLVILAILLLISAGAVLAIEADYIKGVELPFDLF